MKDTLRIVLLTLAVFGAGLISGILSQHFRPFPPPPMGFLDELAFNRDGHDEMRRFPLPPHAAEMQAELDKIRPEIEQFEGKLKVIETDFRARFEAILTPEQRKLLPPPPTETKESKQPGDEKNLFRGMPHRPFAGPLEGLAMFTIFKPALDHFTTELKLTEAQQATLKQLLIERRQRFLDLVDVTPPPSLKLGRIFIKDGHPRH